MEKIWFEAQVDDTQLLQTGKVRGKVFVLLREHWLYKEIVQTVTGNVSFFRQCPRPSFGLHMTSRTVSVSRLGSWGSSNLNPSGSGQKASATGSARFTERMLHPERSIRRAISRAARSFMNPEMEIVSSYGVFM